MNEIFTEVEAAGGGGGGRRKSRKPPSLGAVFAKSLASLYDTLCATSPWFIKCVKPNDVKRPGVYDSVYTLRQLQYLGLLEVIRIRRAGYPVRMDAAAFHSRYGVIDPSCKDGPSLITKIGTKDEWQIGKTKLFMRDQMYAGLEEKRGAVLILVPQEFWFSLKQKPHVVLHSLAEKNESRIPVLVVLAPCVGIEYVVFQIAGCSLLTQSEQPRPGPGAGIVADHHSGHDAYGVREARLGALPGLGANVPGARARRARARQGGASARRGPSCPTLARES